MEYFSKENLMTKYDGYNPIYFYDMTIDIPSLSSMTKNDKSPYGWNVQFSEKGLQRYQNLKSHPLVVGIIGNRNSGKSYILSKLSEYELPRGPNVKTKSISAIFPRYEWNSVCYLDTAGLNNPIMKDEKIIKSMEDNSQEKEIKKDKLFTDLFLISFLVEYSNVPIVCVENLTFSEQQLLQRIRNSDMKYDRIFVVHNLHHLTSKEEVEDYIHNVLKKSSTFEVQEREMFREEGNVNENERIFVEIQKEEEEGYRGKREIVHLIVGSEGTEVGNYYNQSTFNFIRGNIRGIIKRRPFDIIEELMNYYSIKSNEYMKERIGREEIKYDESLGKIYIDNHKQIILKEKFVKSNYEYEYEFLGDDKMKLKIYLPGGKLNNKINNIYVDYEDGYNIVIIEVEKAVFVKIGNDNDSFSNTKQRNFKIILKLPAKEFGILEFEGMNDEKEFGILKFEGMNYYNVRWEEEEINGETKQTEILNITFSVYKRTGEMVFSL